MHISALQQFMVEVKIILANFLNMLLQPLEIACLFFMAIGDLPNHKTFYLDIWVIYLKQLMNYDHKTSF